FDPRSQKRQFPSSGHRDLCSRAGGGSLRTQAPAPRSVARIAGSKRRGRRDAGGAGEWGRPGMRTGVLALLAVAPIALAAVLLVGFRMPARIAMPVVFVASVVIASYFWKMTPQQIAAATAQGLVITFDLVYIIFGAILLLKTLEKSTALNVI